MPDIPDGSNFPESLRSWLEHRLLTVLQKEVMAQAGKKIPACCILDYN
jgi:hypothetical protein